MQRDGLLAAILVAALCVSAGGGDPTNGGRPDLLPVKVRWRALPADVRSVKIDRQRRPWFHITTRGKFSVDQMKRGVERAAGLRAPWLRGGRIVLFDTTGRIWLIPNDRKQLLGYDPRSRKWIQRGVVPVGRRKGYDEKSPKSPAVVFTEPAFESRSGRLYFTDRLGVHVLGPDGWSYKHLYELNLKHGLFYDTIRGFNEPQFAADDAGRVYVWTSWGRHGWTGTVGFFIHDGKTWRQRLVNDWREGGGGDAPVEPPRTDSVKKPDLNRLASVVPLSGGRALACTQTGPVLVVDLRKSLDQKARRRVRQDIALLGNDSWKVREAAHQRLQQMGPSVTPLLKDGLARHDDLEIQLRLERIIKALSTPASVDGYVIRIAQARGVDAAGNTWLWADRCRRPDGRQVRNAGWAVSPAGKVSPLPGVITGWLLCPDSMFRGRKGRMYFARYERGCFMFDGKELVPITDETEMNFRYVLGEDADGCVYLSGEGRVVAVNLDWPEVRPQLPTTIFEVPRAEHVVCLDTDGRLWAVVFAPGAKRATMAWFGPREWNPVDLPGGIKADSFDLRLFMPLKKGRLVVQKVWGNRAFFFDGQRWHQHANLRELVEQRHAELVELIDNRRWGRDFYAKLRLDDQRRIWVIEWTQAAAYDGQRWIDIRRPFKQAHPRADRFDLCIPIQGGKSMLVESRGVFALRLDGDKLQVERWDAPPRGWKIGSDYTTRSGLWTDPRGTLWLPRDDKTCRRVEGGRPQLVRDTGYPRYADSAGGVWFLNPSAGKLTVVDPSGRRGVFESKWLHASSAVVEDAPGSVWVGTKRGLLHLRTKRNDKAIDFQPVKHYTRLVPKGDCLKMFIDRYGNLWFYGPGPRNYRVYRVRLP